jgi:hypothetical protein
MIKMYRLIEVRDVPAPASPATTERRHACAENTRRDALAFFLELIFLLLWLAICRPDNKRILKLPVHPLGDNQIEFGITVQGKPSTPLFWLIDIHMVSRTGLPSPSALGQAHSIATPQAVYGENLSPAFGADFDHIWHSSSGKEPVLAPSPKQADIKNSLMLLHSASS